MTPEDLAQAANRIGYGCVKYADLKQHRISDYQFSYDKMLDLKGNTVMRVYIYVCVYVCMYVCIYTHTYIFTCMRILSSTAFPNTSFHATEISTKKEKR